MSARRNYASGVSDRHAMLSAYGYNYPAQSQQQPPLSRTASPFEQPYASSSRLAQEESLASEYDRKKHDDPSPAASNGGSTWWPTSSTRSGDLQAQQLEEQNDQRLSGLSDRVKILKNITMGIGNEVREGNKELEGFGEMMSGASAYLGGTFKKMNVMARRQGGWFWNMMGFLLFVCWLFVSSSRGTKDEVEIGD